MRKWDSVLLKNTDIGFANYMIFLHRKKICRLLEKMIEFSKIIRKSQSENKKINCLSI